jgi:hypothetical protein
MKTKFIDFHFLLDPDDVSRVEHEYLHRYTFDDGMRCRIFHIEYPKEDLLEYIIYAPRAERNCDS